MKRTAKWMWTLIVGSAGLLGNAVLADDVQCTIKLEACGELSQRPTPLLKISEGGCWKLDLLEKGKKPEGLYATAKIWIGASVAGDTLIFGCGEAKTGVALECAWSESSPKPDAQMESLKASIPQLLKDPRFQENFPGIRNIDVSELEQFETPNRECSRAIISFSTHK